MLEHTLALLCLDEKDRDIYNLGLEIGAQPASVFSRKIGIKRADTYNHLKKLMEMGLMTCFDKNGLSYFEIADFRQMEWRIEEQNMLVKKAKQELIDFQKSVESPKKENAHPKVRFYEGKSGALALLDRPFKNNKGKELRSINYAMDTFERVEHGMHLKELMPFVPEMKQVQKVVKKENRETRFLKNANGLQAKMMNYDEEVLLFGPTENPYGILIQSKELSVLFKLLFENLWKQSGEGT